MPASQKQGSDDSNSKSLTFSELAAEYEKILTENRYGSVGWILLHSKIQKCYCQCGPEALCLDESKEHDNSEIKQEI